jgi:hypothetical protein
LIDIEKALRLLSENHVECIIAGGVAATYHGSSYGTYDLDICYRRTDTNLENLVRALSPLHPRLRGVTEDVPFQFDFPTIKAGVNFTLITDIGDLDIGGRFQD